MDSNTYFIKTEKAKQEIKDKTLKVPLKSRFLLTLIDGMHTVGQLQENHRDRFGDIINILQDLVNQGLIVEKPSAPRVVQQQNQPQQQNQSQEPSKSASSGEIFLEGKKLLISKLLVKVYGPMANSMLPKLNDCQTKDSLYTYTKELRNTIAEGLNRRKAEDFWSKAKDILEK